jgi:hypothetical protein
MGAVDILSFDRLLQLRKQWFEAAKRARCPFLRYRYAAQDHRCYGREDYGTKKIDAWLLSRQQSIKPEPCRECSGCGLRYGSSATTRTGAPLPPAIFIGSAMRVAPRGGSFSRLARFSSP